jgi:hypothetical protein
VCVDQHGTGMDIFFNLSGQMTIDQDTDPKEHQREPK